MPGPPPPPPLGSMPPPPMPAAMKAPKNGGPDDRSALMKSIQKGARLKKTVTNDRSAPIINNKGASNSPPTPNGGASSGAASPAPNGLNLGGLFAQGMPKLRATGKLSGNSPSSSSSSSNGGPTNNHHPQAKSFGNIQNELKKQWGGSPAGDSGRNRGPPPPAPLRQVSDENVSRKSPQPLFNSGQNGIRPNNSSLHSNHQNQGQILHRKVKSNVNLSSLDSPDNVSANGLPQSKPVINHGKPNVAPKPPALNGKPVAPPKKLLLNGKSVSRAHSMKSPRSPSPQSPEKILVPKFGTVRNLSSVLANSTGNLSGRSRPMLNGRPNAPPPSIPMQQPPPPPPHGQSPGGAPPPPPSKTFVKPPNHAPPPPPTFIPQAPSHTPPPPPHRTNARVPPPVPNNGLNHSSNNNNNNSLNAPPPPPRHSSMSSRKNPGGEFEERFRHMFKGTSMFPKPPPYRHVYKHYGSKPAVSKQQAPQPPQIQTASRTWGDTSSAC